MRRRLVTNGVVMLILLLAMTLIHPGGEGVHQLQAGEILIATPNHIWVWDHVWSGSAYLEVSAGTAVTWAFGWGSASRDVLEDTLSDLEIEFYIGGQEVNSPKRYFFFRDVGSRTESYWALYFLYEHRALPPGEYTWTIHLSGSVPETVATGVLEVNPRN
ncbi:MAG: hypothetical protein R6U70_07185 [Bacillota bacterium]